jgi:hypothetical protein
MRQTSRYRGHFNRPRRFAFGNFLGMAPKQLVDRVEGRNFHRKRPPEPPPHTDKSERRAEFRTGKNRRIGTDPIGQLFGRVAITFRRAIE